MGQKTQNLYGFGPFRLNAKEYLLLLHGKPVPLPPKAFEALLILVENAGHLVDRNELMRKLWPDTFVEEGNLAKHVSLLRKILSEASNGKEFIETIPKRGYRFVVEVKDLTRTGISPQCDLPSYKNLAAGTPEPSSYVESGRDYSSQRADEIPLILNPSARDQSKPRLSWLIMAAGSAALLGVAATVVWFALHQVASLPEIKFRQLTAGSAEDPIRYGAISPDGKYLAYADLKGIHVMLLMTGESQSVPQPEVFGGTRVDWQYFRWFPDGIRFLVNQNPPEERERGYSATIWSVPVVGGAPRKLRENGGVESISPDGSLVAFTTDTQNVWLMGPNGERARKIYSSPSNKELRNFRFSANGERLMYVEFPGGDLMSCDLNGGNSVKMLPGEGVRLRDYLWLPDGRIVYSLTEPSPNVNACNIWQLRVANDTGRPEGKPQRLTNWAGSCVENLSATADGKIVAFQQWTVHASAYVADIEGGGTRIATPTRLTVDERWSVPSAWSLDSKSVVVESKFNGQTGIYQERLDTHDSQPLVTGLPDISDQTPFSPDGSWILYSVKPASGSGGQIVRAPVNGGTPEVVMTEANSGVRCTRSPSALCVIADRSVAPTFSLSTFDPLKGRGSELAKIDVDPESECFWDLSPDGQHIAVLEGLSGHVHILSLSDKSIREIKPIGMETSSFINWTADGRAILVSRPSRRGFELLLLGLNGNMHVLWEQIGGLGTSALASPDGKHLAIRGWSVSSNFWSMTNF